MKITDSKGRDWVLVPRATSLDTPPYYFEPNDETVRSVSSHVPLGTYGMESDARRVARAILLAIGGRE